LSPPSVESALPVRSANLDIEEAGDGFIVYQADRDRIHYLNHTATLILEACTGEQDVAEIAALIGRMFSLSRLPLDDVEKVLAQLAEEDLVRWERPGESAQQTD